MCRATRGKLCILVGLAILFISGPAAAQFDEWEVDVSEALAFSQVAFLVGESELTSSAWGKVTIRSRELAQTSGIDSGYVSIFDGEFNLLVLDMPFRTDDDYPELSTYFDLGICCGTTVDWLPANIVVWPTPLAASPVYPAILIGKWALSAAGWSLGFNFPVSQAVWNAWNVLENSWGAPAIEPSPPGAGGLDLPTVASVNAAPDVVLPFSGHNVQAAENQCMPMACANGLQYLESVYGTPVPHQHQMGLRPDATLVGMLEETMDRVSIARWIGVGTWFDNFVEGALNYYGSFALTALTHEHQGRGYGSSSLPNGDLRAASSTITRDHGQLVTQAWLMEQLDRGRTVELVLYWDRLQIGHAVRVFGYGQRASDGTFMLYFLDDETQRTDEHGPGDLQGLRWAWIEATDIDGDSLLNLGSSDIEIVFAMSHGP